VDASDNIYLTGLAESFGEGGRDVFLIKLNSSGTLLWQRVWGKEGNQRGYAVALAPNGEVHVIGTADGFGTIRSLIHLTYSAVGALLSQQAWTATDETWGIGAAFDEDLLIAGLSPDAAGGWVEVDGTPNVPAGTVNAVTGTEGTLSQQDAAASADESSPTGTLDTGGGGNDGLVMRLGPDET
jgi:hypothetical protein